MDSIIYSNKLLRRVGTSSQKDASLGQIGASERSSVNGGPRPRVQGVIHGPQGIRKGSRFCDH